MVAAWARRGSRWVPVEQADVLLGILVLAIITTQRIGVPIGGYRLPVLLPAAYVVLGVGFLRGWLVVQRTRLFGYLLAMVAITVTVVITLARLAAVPDGFMPSITSAAYVAFLYLPFTVVRSAKGGPSRSPLATYQSVMAFFAVVAIGQMAVQLVGLGAVARWDPLPSHLALADFHYLNPLQYGSRFIKPNGYVFVEPSTLSQYLAVAAVVEIAVFRRMANVVLYLVAILVTFSGTGLMLFGVGALVVASSQMQRGRLIVREVLLMLGVLATLALFAVSPLATYTLRRVAEFSNPHASGYIRFVAPYAALGAWASDGEVVFGAGPGYASVSVDAGGMALATPPVKLLVEYGVVGAACFGLFLLITVLTTREDLALLAVLLVSYLVLGGSLLRTDKVLLWWILAAVNYHRGIENPRSRRLDV